MKKIFLSLLVGFLFCPLVLANDISKQVKKTNFGVGSKNSIYVFDKTQNKVIYKHNEKDSLMPASVLKVLSFGAIYKVLGADYNFETAIYQDSNKNLYVKLGGDTLLTQKDLNKLISQIKNVEFNEIYIDDSIFSQRNYPTTWLDEDKWPNSSLITPYIVDNNRTKISFVRSSLAKKVNIIQEDEYKVPFINELKIGDSKTIKILRLYGDESPVVNLQGTIKDDVNMNLAVLKPEIHFNVKLRYALEKNDILYSNIIKAKVAPADSIKIASVAHSIQQISRRILHSSDNFTAEIAFLTAASKYYNKSATLDDGINMFNEIYKAYLSVDDVIYDASGVSRQNKLSTKTIVNIVDKLFEDENFKNLIATSTDGTMAERLLFLKTNLRAKTGTARKLSSLCGCFTTRKGNEIIFATIEQDSKLRNALLKNFENSLIGTIYKKY